MRRRWKELGSCILIVTNKNYGNWQRIIAIPVVITIFFVFVHFNNIRLDKRKRERENFRRYTIGVTNAEHNNIKGSMVIDYDRYNRAISVRHAVMCFFLFMN